MFGNDILPEPNLGTAPGSLRCDQSGGVSIYVSLFVMVILTLVTLGFIQIVGSNYREITDSQLNLQAHYAAESGVNDARKAIVEEIKDHGLLDDFSQRSGGAGGWGQDLELWNCGAGSMDHHNASQQTVGGVVKDNPWVVGGTYRGDFYDNPDAPDVGYSCVDIDLRPDRLVYDQVDQNRSLILPIWPVDDGGNNVDINKFIFNWGDANTGDDPGAGAANEFTTHAAWGNLPVLRIQVTAIPSTFNRHDLNDNTRVFFLHPDAAGSGSTNWPARYSDSGASYACAKAPSPADFPCQFELNMAPGGFNDTYIYLVRVQSIYKDAKFSLTGTHGSAQTAHFQNIQAVVTVTGRGSTILERLRERIPLRPVYDYPEYAIDSVDTVCKILINDPSLGVYLDPDAWRAVPPSEQELCSVHRH